MEFQDVATENIRLVILRELAQTNGYSSNDSVLQMVLERWGHSLSRDRVQTELAWLAEQNLLAIASMGSGSRVTLTSRGLDAAAGRSTVPGVQRPSPRPTMGHL